MVVVEEVCDAVLMVLMSSQWKETVLSLRELKVLIEGVGEAENRVELVNEAEVVALTVAAVVEETEAVGDTLLIVLMSSQCVTTAVWLIVLEMGVVDDTAGGAEVVIEVEVVALTVAVVTDNMEVVCDNVLIVLVSSQWSETVL